MTCEIVTSHHIYQYLVLQGLHAVDFEVDLWKDGLHFSYANAEKIKKETLIIYSKVQRALRDWLHCAFSGGSSGTRVPGKPQLGSQ